MYYMKRKGFTLIELLVVIAIIALLLSIVMPTFRKVKAIAYKVICSSNERQLGIAFTTYESDTGYNFRNFDSFEKIKSIDVDKHWFFRNGTGDYAHEEQPYAVEDIMNNDYLPTYEIFFCPGIRNLAYDKNYALSEVNAGTYTERETGDIYRMVKNGDLPSGDRPLFWSSHVWLWKKEISRQITSVNKSTSGAMMCDMIDESWEFARNTSTTLKNFFDAVDVSRVFQHNNVLMSDMSVENPSDDDEEVKLWLWNSDKWAGIGY